MSKLLVAWLTVGAGILVGACEPEVPAMPTFEKDVKPIFMAQCVRCHGAGDMLRSEPYVNPVTGERVIDPMTGLPVRITPNVCYLDRYDSMGNCPTGADCVTGALDCVPVHLKGRFPAMGRAPEISRMPPFPSEPLNDWEHEVIVRWLASPVR